MIEAVAIDNDFWNRLNDELRSKFMSNWNELSVDDRPKFLNIWDKLTDAKKICSKTPAIVDFSRSCKSHYTRNVKPKCEWNGLFYKISEENLYP